jgi:hypothetical protein
LHTEQTKVPVVAPRLVWFEADAIIRDRQVKYCLSPLQSDMHGGAL